MNDATREAFVWRTHSYINDYIRLADTKAGALFAVFGVFVGLLVRQWTDPIEPHTWWRIALFGAAVAASGIVMLISLDVVRPRTRKSRSGLIFWEHIGDRTLENYRKELQALGETGLFETVTAHVHELSGVATTKYNRLKLAFYTSYPAVVLALACIASLRH